jgi:hypothetical protein
VIRVSKLEGRKSKGMREANVKELQGEFMQSAIDAVMKFTFAPATLNGKPTPASVAIPFRFKLH